MKKGVKIFFAFLVVASLFFTTNLALALELTYPDIPGIGRLSDYQTLEEGKQIGFIVGYVFKLVFFICIGAGAVALITSGVLYIVSLSKPRLLILSKQMAQNAMLGLFILLCAYLFLYTINPQLLNLTLNKPELKQIEYGKADIDGKDTILVEQAPFSQEIKASVDNLAQKVYVNRAGQYYETIKINGKDEICLTNGYGGAVDMQGNLLEKQDNGTMPYQGCVKPVRDGDDKYMYRAEIQLRETANLVKDVVDIVKDKNQGGNIVLGLDSLLEKCKCGTSNGYSDWDIKDSGCKPGLDPAKDKDRIAKLKVEGNYCSIQTQDCGTSEDKEGFLNCDLRDVRKIKQQDGTFILQACMSSSGACPKEECWLTFTDTHGATINSGTLGKANCTGKNGRVDNLIKLKILKLQEIQAKFEARSRLSTNFLDSAFLVGKALDVNRIEFVTSQANGYWGYDFADMYDQWKDKYNVVVEPYKSAIDYSSQSQFTAQAKPTTWIAKIKSFFAPVISAANTNQGASFVPRAGNFYFVKKAPESVLSPEVVAKNKAISRDAQRYNLFSVITDLAMEDIEGIFKACLVLAFGEAEYNLDPEQIAKVIKQAIDSGATDHLQAVLTSLLDKAAQASADGTLQAAQRDIGEKLLQNAFNQCKSSGCAGKNLAEIALQIEKGCTNDAKTAIRNTCCYCINNLIKDSIPPHFASKTIAGALGTSLADALPNIRNILNTTVRENLFPADRKIGKFLDDKTIDVYDKILQGALKKPLSKTIPGLDDLLQKQVKDVLPNFIANQIESINGWFTDTVNYTKSLVKKYSQGFANSLANEYIKQPIHEWAERQFDKMGIGTEHLTISECYKNWLEKGYVYKNYEAGINQFNIDITAGKEPREPGQCLKLSAQEINNLDKAPDRFIFTGYGLNAQININNPVNNVDLKEKDKQAICKGAGYSWRACSYKATPASADGNWGLPDIAPNEYCCMETDDLIQDISGALETATDADKAKTFVAGGAVRYVEKLTIAFTETALQGALAYARVFVEDNIVYPFLSSWNVITGFQKGMEWFMTASIAQILPNQIRETLQSSLENSVDNFCRQYKTAKSALGEKVTEKTEITFIFKIYDHLPIDIQFNDASLNQAQVTISQEMGDKICQLSQHFGTTVYEQLIYYSCERYPEGSEWKKTCIEAVKTLREPLITALSKICVGETCFNINDWFDKSMASIIFPGILGVEKLAELAPKNLMCGEFLTWQNGKITISPNNANSIKSKCQSAVVPKLGIVPAVNKVSFDNLFSGANSAQKDDLASWCNFINAACSIPLGVPTNKTIGEMIKTIVRAGCNSMDSQKEKFNCFGNCYCQYNCPDNALTSNNACLQEIKTSCEFCSLMDKNSLGFTLFLKIIESDIGPVSHRTPEKLETEKDDYKWLLTYFPTLENDIKAVAIKREVVNQSTSWQSIKERPLKTDLENKLNALVKLAFAGISQNSIRAMLNQMDYLNLDLYALLTTQACPIIEKSYSEKYPEYTFANIEIEGLDKIRTVLPYSMESVQTFTTADKMRLIANLPPSLVDSDLKDGYLFCISLNKTPKELLGLDQLLKTYLRPQEYIILMDLLNFELREGNSSDCVRGEYFEKDFQTGETKCCDDKIGLCYFVGERPGKLNLFLDYVYSKDPIDALREVQKTMPESTNEEKVIKEKVAKLIIFMETPLGASIKDLMTSQKISDYLCQTQALKDICDLEINKQGLQTSVGTLEKTPLDLIALYFDKKILPASFSGKSFMDNFTGNNVLGNPVLDTIFQVLNLEKSLATVVGGAQASAGWVDQGATKGVMAIQDGLETALAEWPLQAAQSIASLFSLEVGKKKAANIAGGCYEIKPTEACDVKEQRREKDGKTECCILAKAQACSPMCRIVDDKTKQCNILAGEIPEPTIMQTGKKMCCFNKKQAGVNQETGEPIFKCQKCRAVNFEAGAKCRLKDENGNPYETDFRDKNLCCFDENYSESANVSADASQAIIESMGYCCTTVSQCISNKMAGHLENLAEMMADGKMPLKSLIDSKK